MSVVVAIFPIITSIVSSLVATIVLAVVPTVKLADIVASPLVVAAIAAVTIDLVVTPIAAAMCAGMLVVRGSCVLAMTNARMVAMPVAIVGSRSRSIVGFDNNDFGLDMSAEYELSHRGQVIGRNAAQFVLEARFEFAARLSTARDAEHQECYARCDDASCATPAQL